MPLPMPNVADYVHMGRHFFQYQFLLLEDKEPEVWYKEGAFWGPCIYLFVFLLSSGNSRACIKCLLGAKAWQIWRKGSSDPHIIRISFSKPRSEPSLFSSKTVHSIQFVKLWMCGAWDTEESDLAWPPKALLSKQGDRNIRKLCFEHCRYSRNMC